MMKDIKREFAQAEKNWNLEKLYTDLAKAKAKFDASGKITFVWFIMWF